MAKVLNGSKLLSQFPVELAQKPSTDCAIQLRSSRTEYILATNPNICQICGNLWDSGPVWNRGIKDHIF